MKLYTILFVFFVLSLPVIGQEIVAHFPADSLLNEVTAKEKKDSWVSIDKGQHFAGSMIGTILLSQVNNRYLNINKSSSKYLGIGIVFSVGLTKELVDSNKDNNFFSYKDMIANIAGMLSGLLIMEIK